MTWFKVYCTREVVFETDVKADSLSEAVKEVQEDDDPCEYVWSPYEYGDCENIRPSADVMEMEDSE